MMSSSMMLTAFSASFLFIPSLFDKPFNKIGLGHSSAPAPPASSIGFAIRRAVIMHGPPVDYGGIS